MFKVSVAGLLVLAAQSVFAYGTRSITAVKGTDSEGRSVANLAFSPDSSGFVSKYDLYLAWASADGGDDLTRWSGKRKLGEVASADSTYTCAIPAEAENAGNVRFFLVNPTYAEGARADGVELINVVEATRSGDSGCFVATGYTPTSTTTFDYSFAATNKFSSGKHYTIFCSRTSSTFTYTSFLHGYDDKGSFNWRLDYGHTQETEGNLGFRYGVVNHVRTVADGTGATMTLENPGVSTRYRTEGAMNGAINELALFSAYGAAITESTKSHPGNYLLYGFRAIDGGSLRLNLLPARQTSAADGSVAIGLYDTVSGRFLKSTGARQLRSVDAVVSPALSDVSELLVYDGDRGVDRQMVVTPHLEGAGPAVASVDIAFRKSETRMTNTLSAVYSDGTVVKLAEIGSASTNLTFTPVKKRTAGSFRLRLEPKLPEGYTPVAYAVKARVDKVYPCLQTGYYARGTTAVRTQIEFRDGGNEGTTAWAIFCSRETSKVDTGKPGMAAFMVYGGDSVTKWRYDYGTANGTDSPTATTNRLYTISASVPGGFAAEWTSETGSVSVTTAETAKTYQDFKSKGKLVLFASYNELGSNGIAREYTNNRTMNIYWLTIKDESGDIATLVPAQASDGTVGFWDFAQGVFRTSATTAPFQAGGAAVSSLRVESADFPVKAFRGFQVFFQ